MRYFELLASLCLRELLARSKICRPKKPSGVLMQGTARKATIGAPELWTIVKSAQTEMDVDKINGNSRLAIGEIVGRAKPEVGCKATRQLFDSLNKGCRAFRNILYTRHHNSSTDFRDLRARRPGAP